ncbi:MAG TPA: helix-turn-helix transcriptional regulator [Terriglobales bacterium]|nr:helix-turn-helix transcriptional regulator [Terriglobales bacterium]
MAEDLSFRGLEQWPNTSPALAGFVAKNYPSHYGLSETASLISDPGRASMLMALMSGINLPAGQLAMIANVAPQTASSHLSRMVSGRLLVVEQQGRHRYYRLADTEVAHAIEALLAVAPIRSTRSRKDLTHATRVDHTLAFARTCYSHLAGKLAVEIAAALQQRHYVVPAEPRQSEVTESGRKWFRELGIPITEMQAKHPRFARRCLDWTERRHHIAGKLGSAMLTRFRELRWVAPIRGSRALRVTVLGVQEFQRRLDIRLPANLQPQ